MKNSAKMLLLVFQVQRNKILNFGAGVSMGEEGSPEERNKRRRSCRQKYSDLEICAPLQTLMQIPARSSGFETLGRRLSGFSALS